MERYFLQGIKSGNLKLAVYSIESNTWKHYPVSSKSEALELRKKLKRNSIRREKNQIMKDLGLTRVIGNLGGVYWE